MSCIFLKIAFTTSREIVENTNVVPVLQESGDEIGSDEAETTSNDYLHTTNGTVLGSAGSRK